MEPFSYTKQQFLNSTQFSAAHKDILNALLEDGESYTTEQVKELIKTYLERVVQ